MLLIVTASPAGGLVLSISAAAQVALAPVPLEHDTALLHLLLVLGSPARGGMCDDRWSPD
jgi:hypothetical protein